METGVIYEITNKQSNISYIGQTRNFGKRINEHFIGHGNSSLFADIIRLGKENFKYEIIEDNVPVNDLIKREKHYILEHKRKHKKNRKLYNDKSWSPKNDTLVPDMIRYFQEEFDRFKKEMYHTNKENMSNYEMKIKKLESEISINQLETERELQLHAFAIAAKEKVSEVKKQLGQFKHNYYFYNLSKLLDVESELFKKFRK